MPEWRMPGEDAWTRYAIWGPVRDDVKRGEADGWVWVRKKIGEEERRAFQHPMTRDLFSEHDLTDMLMGRLHRRATTPADAVALLGDVDALLNSGAKADTKDEEGRTLLHLAAMRQSSPEVVKALVNAGARLEEKDSRGRTVLDYAKARRESGILASLGDGAPAEAESPDPPVEPQSTPERARTRPQPVESAAAALPTPDRPQRPSESFEGQETTFLTDKLLEALRRPAKTAAEVAALLGDVNALLRLGAKADAPDEEGRTALHVAAMWQSGPEVVTALLRAGAAPRLRDTVGQTALSYAIERRQSDMVHVLISRMMPAERQVRHPEGKPMGPEPAVARGRAHPPKVRGRLVGPRAVETAGEPAAATRPRVPQRKPPRPTPLARKPQANYLAALRRSGIRMSDVVPEMTFCGALGELAVVFVLHLTASRPMHAPRFRPTSGTEERKR